MELKDVIDLHYLRIRFSSVSITIDLNSYGPSLQLPLQQCRRTKFFTIVLLLTGLRCFVVSGITLHLGLQLLIVLVTSSLETPNGLDPFCALAANISTTIIAITQRMRIRIMFAMVCTCFIILWSLRSPSVCYSCFSAYVIKDHA